MIPIIENILIDIATVNFLYKMLDLCFLKRLQYKGKIKS